MMYERIGSTQTSDTIDLADVIRTLKRNSTAVLLFVAFGFLAALAVVLFAPRRFEARTTIMAKVGSAGGSSISSRMEGIGELLGGLGSLAGASGIETELQILRSRELAGLVVDSLKLQYQVTEPRIAPFKLVDQGSMSGSFGPRKIRFERTAANTYGATWGDTSFVVKQGEPVTLGAGNFTLRTGSLPEKFEIVIVDREAAIDRFVRRTEATKAGGEVAKVVVRGDDSLSTAYAANLLTQFYLETHKTVDRGINQRRVEFVQSQLDSTSRELARAERELRENQETTRVLDFEIVGAAQVQGLESTRGRLTDLQVEEGTMRQLLAQAESGGISSKDLAAYPGFLRGTNAGQLAGRLTELEARRIELLERRTEKDPDVIAVDKTMRSLEASIVAMARSYAGSISKQRAEIQGRVDSLQRRLLAIPAAAERGGRLKRDVVRLTQLYTALQAQLVEARFSAVSEGGLLRQLDAAVPPRGPSFPRPFLTMGIGISGGLFAGILAALFIGWFGRWLRDPMEVERAVGVLAQQYEPNAPLLMSSGAGARTILLVPLGARAPLGIVAERLARTARQRALQTVILDLTAPHEGNGAGSNGDYGAMIDKLERENGAVIVQLPALASEAAFASLSENRPVILVAPPGPIERDRLENAVNTLRRLKVPCAGVIMNDNGNRALT
jgi:uncharacterized protein involved in exopolysaccharide biosynthesis